MERNCRKCGTLFDAKYCPACVKARSEKWYLENHERALEARRKYRKANKEKLVVAGAKWRAENKDKIKRKSEKYWKECRAKVLAANKKWKAANPEKVKQYWKNCTYKKSDKGKQRARERARQWNLENPGKAKDRLEKWLTDHPDAKRIYGHNRRNRERSGKLSKDLASRLFKLQKGKCPCCGEALGSDYQLDHKMPLALGGANEDWNMQLLRKRCNIQKHAKHPVDFMQSRGFLL